jgi:hypothetical protein
MLTAERRQRAWSEAEEEMEIQYVGEEIIFLSRSGVASCSGPIAMAATVAGS